jgi:hypothetical protein
MARTWNTWRTQEEPSTVNHPLTHAAPPLRDSERGGTLIFVLALLALFSLYGVALVSVLNLEQRAAANTLDAVRAEAVADAGLQRALYLLSEHELTDPIASVDAPWYYRAQDGTGPGIDLPVGEARHPSFFAGQTPSGISYSGQTSATYGVDLFSLQVVDENSLLCLNSGHPALAAQLDVLGESIQRFEQRRATPGDALFSQAYVDRLQGLYDSLVTEVGQSAARARVTPADPVRGLGAQIVALRDSLGGAIRDLADLEALLGSENLARLKPYVSLHAWLDPRRSLEAPININTAPWPVLVSCFEGARHLEHEINSSLAQQLADLIDEQRRDAHHGPFVDFDHVREALVTIDVSKQLRYVIMAAARGDLVPAGVNLNDALHDPEDFGFLDQRLLPFCYVTYGRFRVRSLGRVLDGAGQVIARATVEASVAVYDVLRLSTQEDMEMARDSKDGWSVDSYPEATGVGGDRRLGVTPSESGGSSLSDGASRGVRFRLASSISGYLIPRPNPPGLPPTGPALVKAAQSFRLNADLHGEDITGVTWAPGEPPQRMPGSLAALLRPQTVNAGAHPQDLGLPGLPVAEGVETADTTSLSPAGLQIDDRIQSVTWENTGGDKAPLGSSGMLSIRFQLNGTRDWVTLFTANVKPDAGYVGLAKTDRIKIEVRAKLTKSAPGKALIVESRIVSGVAPAVATDPSLPPEFAFDQAQASQRVVLSLPAGADISGAWHQVVLVRHLNAHALFADGQPGVPWPVAARPFAGLPNDTFRVGGGITPAAMHMLDDLRLVSFEGDGGAQLLRSYVGQAWPPTLPLSESRWARRGPDVLGRFTGSTLSFPEGSPRLGPLVWSEFRPQEWNGRRFEPCDFLGHARWGFGEDPPRSAVSRRLLPAPSAGRLADPYVRYWRLRQLREHLPRAALLAARASAWATLASAPPTPGFTSLNARAEALTAEHQALLDEERQILSSYGEPNAPPSDTESAAFGAKLALRSSDQRLRFQLEFVFCDRLNGGSPSGASSMVVSEILVPYQTTPRTLSRTWE